GEDVVAGIRTPQPVARQSGATNGQRSLEDAMPAVYAQLTDVYKNLESHYRDMQDIEFTVQQSKLWLLQTRSGKRTAKAMVKIAVDQVNEGLISREEAISRLEPNKLTEVLLPIFDPRAKRDVVATGLAASPGA